MNQLPEDDKLLIDHDYDGIQELDNSLPQWWLYGFYFTMVFAVVYFVYFHVTTVGPSMEQEFLREMREAGYRVPPTNAASARQEYLLGLLALLGGLFFYLISLIVRYDRKFMGQARAEK